MFNGAAAVTRSSIILADLGSEKRICPGYKQYNCAIWIEPCKAQTVMFVF